MLSAVGSQNDSHHPQIMRASIQRSPFDRFVSSQLSWFPSVVQDVAISVAPCCSLPSDLVVKKLKLGWDAYFDHEKHLYERMKPLQGIFIPRCFGEAECDGTRALLLSDVGGVEVCHQKPPFLPPDEFQRRLEINFAGLAKLGLVYGDLDLDDIRIVDDRLVILATDSVYEGQWDDKGYLKALNVQMVRKMYEKHLRAHPANGEALRPARQYADALRQYHYTLSAQLAATEPI